MENPGKFRMQECYPSKMDKLKIFKDFSEIISIINVHTQGTRNKKLWPPASWLSRC